MARFRIPDSLGQPLPRMASPVHHLQPLCRLQPAHRPRRPPDPTLAHSARTLRLSAECLALLARWPACLRTMARRAGNRPQSVTLPPINAPRHRTRHQPQHHPRHRSRPAAVSRSPSRAHSEACSRSPARSRSGALPWPYSRPAASHITSLRRCTCLHPLLCKLRTGPDRNVSSHRVRRRRKLL